MNLTKQKLFILFTANLHDNMKDIIGIYNTYEEAENFRKKHMKKLKKKDREFFDLLDSDMYDIGIKIREIVVGEPPITVNKLID